MWLTESRVRARAIGYAASLGVEVALGIHALIQALKEACSERFDIFLSHSIRDAELVLGVKVVLEDAGKSVYIDWIEDPALDRAQVTGKTADMLRSRMRACDSLLYLYSQASQRSRWMPWELGYFDGFNGNVAILPVVPEGGALDFDREEYLQLYPKVDVVDVTGNPSLHVNRSRRLEQAEHKSFDRWRSESEKLRPQF
jgi:hypothetical protein